MAGIIVDTSNATRSLQGLEHALAAPRPLLEIVAEELYRVTRQSFEKEQSPGGRKWRPLSRLYAARKSKLFPGRGILRARGQLVRSIQRGVERNTAFVTAGNLVYAGIHQRGGRAGRGKTAKIPARPYMGLPPESQRRVALDIEQVLKRRFDGGR